MAQLFLINDRCEEALAVIVAAVAGEVPVVVGKNAGDRPASPMIICTAVADGTNDPPGSGNSWVDCSVGIETSAVPDETGQSPEAAPEDPAAVKAANEALVAAVFGAICVADLAAQMTAAVDDLTVFPASVQFGATENGFGANGYWNDMLHFRCYAAGADLN